jgi:chromosome segregation ATPase
LNDAIYHFAQVVEREQQANQAAEQVNAQRMEHQQELNQVKDLLTSCTARLSHLEDQVRQLNRDKFKTEGEERDYIILELANINQKIEETKTEQRNLHGS